MGWDAEVVMPRLRGFLLVALFGTIPAVSDLARADLLYFKKGGAVQLPCRRDGSRLILDAPGGPLTFEADDFRLIVPGGDPAAEWPSRLEAARTSGNDRLLSAAWWALENGLTPEATATLRAVHSADPSHEPTATLVRTLDSVEPRLPDPDAGQLPDGITRGFRTARSPHFLLHYRGDEAEATARLDLLERVYTSFFLTFAGQGIVLGPPPHRLTAVVFATQAEYVEFLKRENAGAFATTQGYYHPSRDAVFSFDARDLPSIRSRREAIDRDLARTASLPLPAGLCSDLARRSLILDLERLSLELGVAAHETIHQLVTDARLVPRHDAFPTWLHEGLAAQFEVIRGGRWAGVGRSHDLRLPDWRALRPSPRLAPLVRDEGFGQGYRKDLYAEAWSLVYFLRKTRATDFTRFLDLLRSPSPEPRDDLQTLALFRTCFGDDVSILEGEWHRFMRSVTTPLESGPSAPRGLPAQIQRGLD